MIPKTHRHASQPPAGSFDVSFWYSPMSRHPDTSKDPISPPQVLALGGARLKTSEFSSAEPSSTKRKQGTEPGWQKPFHAHFKPAPWCRFFFCPGILARGGGLLEVRLNPSVTITQ